MFLDISQAFDRVWHEGILYKLKEFLPPTYYLLIKSYLTDRHFQIRYRSALSDVAAINDGVPQGGILYPILYNIFTSDQPTTPNISIADYADDKAIISIDNDLLIASNNLQTHLGKMVYQLEIQSKPKQICPYSPSNTLPVLEFFYTIFLSPTLLKSNISGSLSTKN